MSLRWPEGFACPKCDAAKHGVGPVWRWFARVVVTRPRSRPAHCSKRRTNRCDWFKAMWLATSQKTGASALGLRRVLGLGSYETTWLWLHKLSPAIVRPGRDRLKGCAEVDETMWAARRRALAPRNIGKVHWSWRLKRMAMGSNVSGLGEFLISQRQACLLSSNEQSSRAR
jgi:hypothetical protein